ncbi:MAG: helix-turn-helix domain-containing protein, partial [Muribaculaceae bacterium]|nr:helix-turn-helix domain-containing protein [Muribaculaceae bacterium]
DASGRKPREKKKKEPKPKPAPSREVTLKLLRQGMTRQEIADERNLALSTVTSHLQSYVSEGELELEDVYGTAMVNAMESALDRVGLDGGLEPMISALKDTGLSPYDGRFFISTRREEP